MTNYYKFPCGCEVEIIDEKIKDYDGLPTLKIDYDNIPFDCEDTWDLICNGNTKGVFQLESGLGMSWAKKVKPRNIDELSGLISLIRPGCLDAIVDGKNMTRHFVDRKNGEEEWKNFDPSIDSILNETYGIIIYQEQAMSISKIIAGFDLKQADNLRKATGKKDSALMAKVRIEFLEGCRKTGIVDDDIASAIFDIIEKSGRYSFNKSHGVSYAVTAYQTAWAKQHFPLQFFCAYLSYAKESIDPKHEISSLIRNSKFSNDVPVFIPDVRSIYETDDFYIKSGAVYFGLSNIRGAGKKKLEKFRKTMETFLPKLIEDFTWKELLIGVLPSFDKSVITSLIRAGAFSFVGLQRKVMCDDFDLVSELTERELTFLSANMDKFNTIQEALKFLAISGICKGKRVVKIAELAKSTDNVMSSSLRKDTMESVVRDEKELLGIALSGSKVMSRRPVYVTQTCDMIRPSLKDVIIAVEISEIKTFVQKNGKMAGKEMAFLTCEDDLGIITVLAFAQKYEEFKYLCFEGNTVVIYGRTDEQSTLFVDRIEQI